MCLEACLPNSYWEFAVEHSVHCYNRTPVWHLNWCTPFEALNRTAPSISHLWVFGCGAYVYLPQDVRKDKLAPKLELMIYLGVAEGIKGHHFMYSTQQITNYSLQLLRCLMKSCSQSAKLVNLNWLHRLRSQYWLIHLNQGLFLGMIMMTSTKSLEDHHFILFHLLH